jgi:hypothetical protein
MREPQKLRVLLIDRVRNPRPVWRQVAWRVTEAAMRLAAYCGIPPHEMLGILLLRRRGHSVRVLNQLRGLTPPSPHDMSASELRARYAKEPDSSSR